MFRKITIKVRIIILAVFGIAVAIGIASTALYSLNAVGKKLVSIAEEDIPLTNAVTEITAHQLEQAIHFERALRYAEFMTEDYSAQKHYKKEKDYFWKLAHKVDEEILAAEKQTEHILEVEAHNPKMVKEYSHVLEILKKIEKEHKDFDHHVEDVFKLYEAGKISKAHKMAEKVEEEEDHLNHELESLLKELETFTAEAALEAEHLEKDALKMLLILTTISSIVAAIFAFFLVRSVVRPLHALEGAMVKISDGDLETKVPQFKNEDETTAMSRALEVFRDQALTTKRLEEEALKAQARAEEQKRQVMLDMADDFDHQVGGSVSTLASAASELRATAESMKKVAEDTSQSAQTVAAAAEESSTNVNTVASAMEEMSASSSEIASQMSVATTRSTDMAHKAEQANGTVSNLNSLVEGIGEVVVSIQNIAEQTNLLALNATIEAARAGEAGKGFAVVADEVKKLASETSKKTEEINTQITGIQEATRASVDAMQEIISNIAEIDTSITGVSAAVEEQNATTSEISRSITEASQGAQEVSQVIGSVQSGADETGGSADAVLAAAQELAQLSEGLTRGVNDFLAQIRGDNETNSEVVEDAESEALDEGEDRLLNAAE
jgi:methyl-accepting chemotaxis protein